jgi:hypothetical protein
MSLLTIREAAGCPGRSPSLMAKKLKRSWSMKADRELIDLSKTNSLETLVEHFQRRPESILRKGKRLGLRIKRQRAK